MKPSPGYLLAVDVGLHTGLALFAQGGQLLWYRSHHLPSPGKLKSALYGLLDSEPRPTHLILEGGGPLADIWIREAERRQLPLIQIQAEDWRKKLLYPRQQRDGRLAKRSAEKLARKAILLLGGKRPTAMPHDTAEAILVGLYGLIQLNWLPTNVAATPSLLERIKN